MSRYSSEIESFAERVYRLTRQIPSGKVSTYGLIAKALGKPGASRAVGTALASNPSPIKTPCHRVVRSDGDLGGYMGGIRRKVELLSAEGISVVDRKVQNFDRFLYSDFRAT